MKSIAIAAVTLALLVFAAPAEATCHHCADATEDYVSCMMESGDEADCTGTYTDTVGGHAQEHVEELDEHLP